MNKKQGILFVIALMLLFTGIATSTSLSASSDVEIYAFDQNPAGSESKLFFLLSSPGEYYAILVNLMIP